MEPAHEEPALGNNPKTPGKVKDTKKAKEKKSEVMKKDTKIPEKETPKKPEKKEKEKKPKKTKNKSKTVMKGWPFEKTCHKDHHEEASSCWFFIQVEAPSCERHGY